MNETPNLHLSNEEAEDVECEVAPTFIAPRSNRSRRSINILLESLKVCHTAEEDFLATYQERLKQEIKDWKTIYADHIQIFSAKPPTIGMEALSAKNRAYLDAAPQLQRYHNEFLKFRKRAALFLEAEYLPMQEKIDRSLDICDFMKEHAKEQLINERETHHL